MAHLKSLDDWQKQHKMYVFRRTKRIWTQVKYCVSINRDRYDFRNLCDCQNYPHVSFNRTIKMHKIIRLCKEYSFTAKIFNKHLKQNVCQFIRNLMKHTRQQSTFRYSNYIQIFISIIIRSPRWLLCTYMPDTK